MLAKARAKRKNFLTLDFFPSSRVSLFERRKWKESVKEDLREKELEDDGYINIAQWKRLVRKVGLSLYLS